MNNEMTTDNMSNEEAIEVLKGIVFGGFSRTTSKERQALVLAIKALEDRPQGVWTTDKIGYFYCDKCGKYPDNQLATTPYCPSCGADMRGGTK